MGQEHIVTMSNEEKERIANEKLREEFMKTQQENRKLEAELRQIGVAARKTDAEIQKLQAEILQLTMPWKTLQFYLSLATIAVSFVLALFAGYGVLLQKHRSDAELKEKDADLKEKIEKIKELEKTSEVVDHQLKERKSDLQKSMAILRKAEDARKLAEGVLVFSSKQTLGTYDDLRRRANPESINDDYEVQFAKERLSQTLDALEKNSDDPGVVAELLKHDSDDVRRLAGLLLSRLKKGTPEAPRKRADLARKILEALKAEKHLDCKRLQIAAVARLGKDAAQPLLDELDNTESEVRLNIVRALGELNREATAAVIDRLIALLTERGENRILKRQAALALGSIGVTAQRAENAMAAILPVDLGALLGYPETYLLCREVIASLGKIRAKNPATIPRLTRFFEVTDPKGDNRLVDELRIDLLRTLGRFGPEAMSVSSQIKAILAVDPVRSDVLETGAVALARIGNTAEIEELLKAEEFDGLTKDAVRQRRTAGLIALTAMRSSEDRLKCLKTLLIRTVRDNTEKSIRIDNSGNFLTPSVINSVKKRGTDAVPVLADALAMVQNPYVRENLTKALGETGHGSPIAVQALIGALLDSWAERKNPYVQMAAIRSLEKLGIDSDRVKNALLQVADDKSVEVRVRLFAQGALFGKIQVDKKWENEWLKPDSKYDMQFEKYYNVHSYPFQKGYLYQIDLISHNFDTFLYLKKGDKTLTFDDDSGANLNARLIFEPDQNEQLDIWATSYPRRALGDYTLEIRKISKGKNY